MAYEYEYTDTFGGEANYCWVQRGRLELRPEARWPRYGTPAYQAMLTRAAKAAVGLTGVKCDVDNYGDQLRIVPRGMARVLFVNWAEG